MLLLPMVSPGDAGHINYLGVTRSWPFETRTRVIGTGNGLRPGIQDNEGCHMLEEHNIGLVNHMVVII